MTRPGAGVRYWTGSGWASYLTDVIVEPENPDIFQPETTEPTLLDPLNPTSFDNVGWDGNDEGGPVNTEITVASGETVSNRVFNRMPILTDSTSTLDNCLIYGSPYDIGYRPGLVRAWNGGTLNRCTIWGTPENVTYYTNAISHRAGQLNLTRNAFFRCVDMVHTSSSNTAKIVAVGNLHGRYAFFDNDQDHATGNPPYWTHNDAYQILTASTQQHSIIGDKIESFFDTTGVVWSGGSWGSGTASGGEIGMPSTALNAGYWSAAGKGTWANGITFSNSSGHKALLHGNWINGVNATSGMMQWTQFTTPNQVDIKRNKFGLGGKPSGSGRFYLVTYNSNTIASIADNVYQNNSSVPVALRGKPVVFTASGASIIP